MKKERYEINAEYVDNRYLFTLDYGTSTPSSCSVLNDGTVFIDFGESAIFDKRELLKRKKDITKEILEPMFGNDAVKLVEKMEDKIPSAFEKAEKYVIDNDMFVSCELEQELRKEKEYNEDYEYKTVYDESFGTVSFYIKSKLFDDEIGIIIYSDGSFTPVISTRHINLTDEFKNQRLNAIKKFISITLKVNINFGTVDEFRSLRIDDLSKRAIEFAKEKVAIVYTDDKDTQCLYKESQPDITSLNGIGSV